MHKLRQILALLTLCLLLQCCKQTKSADANSETHETWAKLVALEAGDKIHLAKFKILKTLSGNLNVNDTITVGYYNYKQPDPSIDTVLLTVKNYDGQTTVKNYFICPDYDGKTYIRKQD